MLNDAKDITDLWQMVEGMKTSDASSESKGKRSACLKLLEEFYGKNDGRIHLEKMIKDTGLLNDLNTNKEVRKKVEQHWKDPMFTLLHMLHYGKERRRKA